MVDAGLGALLKRFAEGIRQDWLAEDANWEEWTVATLPACRKRILLTQWYGEAWERVFDSFDFEDVFGKCGSSLTADGSEDDKIKLQKLDTFSFVNEMKDAERDAKTGEFEIASGSQDTPRDAPPTEDETIDEDVEQLV